MNKQFNLSRVRLQKQAIQMKKNCSSDLQAVPVESDLLTWHFTIKGPPDSDFQEGYYHGKILLPPQYPLKAPSIIFINPNGKFQTNTQICLNNTKHHPEQWNTVWNIRVMLQSIRQIFSEHTQGIGHIGNLASQDKKRMAQISQSYNCQLCGPIKDILDRHITSQLTQQKPPKIQQDGCHLKLQKLKEQSLQTFLNRPIKFNAELQAAMDKISWF